ncbi:hypothetical protein SAMN02745751_01169 [Dethiosulfatibacter aminovorans DSM 17477]|uniref:Uncharacterized protein n=1 Tax=Dethiosulfatibacter aminovorans DSM 17477 TaxID=1121476 RepID=A0A1M6EE09_9FIRM|nr:hypothetical protein [Dethiosulfatibacter aminovorans]SHI83757.1 hypothetical protein SAMN02745751_01169 [Dethiosulfatibacter aminovorans DSM 17477]
MKRRTYLEGTYFYGVIATLISMMLMLGIPAIICSIYDIWPTFAQVFAVAGPLLAMYVPSVAAEVVSFTPITGTAGYIASITGNVMNIKFPCALSAMEATEATPSTEKGDVISMCAMCISGMVTMVVVAVGVVMLVPLAPVLTTPFVTTATNYVMPALFGSMALTAFLSKNAGNYTVKGKIKIAILPMMVVLLVHTFIMSLSRYVGFVMLVIMPFTVFCAYVMYKKGWVEVKDKNSKGKCVKAN